MKGGPRTYKNLLLLCRDQYSFSLYNFLPFFVLYYFLHTLNYLWTLKDIGKDIFNCVLAYLLAHDKIINSLIEIWP